MSYKNKFNASKDQAHNQNIATKILRDLSKLRSTIQEDTSNSRRWIWELIQNAKDVAREDGVTIQIFKEKEGDFWFCHDGIPFRADNIRYLVEQISTKDQDEEDENGQRQTTGKFGTGFLTTHLLSEKVTVHGVLREEDEPYKKFQVELDRTGYSNREIISSVKESREILNEVDDLPDLVDYNPQNMNTRFQYPISDEIGIKIMKDGIADLISNIGYALSISNQIKEVKIGRNRSRIYKSDNVVPLGIFDEVGEIVEIVIENSLKEDKTLHYAILKKNFTSIVVPVEKEGDVFSILDRDENVPSLFCEFPLIGSTSFSFPAVINNPNFNPTEPRDGVTLTTSPRPDRLSVKNKEFIAEAIELYEIFAEYATENQWGNLHLLARIDDKSISADWLSKPYFENTVIRGVRNVIRKKNIITAADGSMIPLFNDRNDAFALIPRISKSKLRDKLWEKGTTVFANKLPSKEHIDFWETYAWDNCGKFNSLLLCKSIEQSQTVEILDSLIRTNDIFEWLNSFYILLEEDTVNYDRLINNYKIFPDQNGSFAKRDNLNIQEGNINETFKNILAELGEDVRQNLLDTNITYQSSDESTTDESDLIRSINGTVPDKANNREISKRYRSAFNLLLSYFRENEKEARTKFPTLYRDKYILFDEDEMIANVERVEQLDELLEEFDLENISEIKKVLSERSSMDKNSHELLPITSEIISSLGITNVEDWKEAMKDKDLAAMFDHTSITTPDMFVLAATYIERAKKSIVAHLNDLEGYDTNDHFFTANTILGGVEKDGFSVDIVCRPAYKNEVIIYYESERAVLREAGELWIDSANGVERITLGRILDKAQIRKFPI